MLSSNTGTKDKFIAYGSFYLTVPGTYATVPMLTAWMANNSEPYYRRASSVAAALIMINSVNNFNYLVFTSNVDSF